MPGRSGAQAEGASSGSTAGRSRAALEPDADPVAVARTLCLRWLTLRAHSRAELATKLARRGVPDEAAATVLDRFTEIGLICDEEFAAGYVRSGHEYKKLGRRAITAGLRRTGVDDETVRASVAAVSDEAERAAALSVARSRAGRLGTGDMVSRQRRLAGVLARRGYPPGVVYSVVREVLGGPEIDPEATT